MLFACHRQSTNQIKYKEVDTKGSRSKTEQQQNEVEKNTEFVKYI